MWSYLATDISSGMIAIAEEKLAAEPIPDLSFRTATVEELVHEESRFDAVLGFDYLHLVRDVPGTLRSIHVLLKPRGLFISKTPCPGDMNPLIRLLLLPAMRTIGKAPHASSVGAFALEHLIMGAGFDILVRESHASKGKDQRHYIVACKQYAKFQVRINSGPPELSSIARPLSPVLVRRLVGHFIWAA